MKELSDERAVVKQVIRKGPVKGRKVSAVKKTKARLLANMKSLIRLLGKKTWNFDRSPFEVNDVASAKRTPQGKDLSRVYRVTRW